MKDNGLGINDYDNRGNIRPGLMIPFFVIYFGRYLLSGILSPLAGLNNSFDLTFLTNHHPLLMMTSVLPVSLGLLILVGDIHKSNIRATLWSRGREILVATGLVQIFSVLVIDYSKSQVTETSIAAQFFTAYMVYLVFTNPRVKLFFLIKGKLD
tara:strand:- start:375 stop:836 length:462 start_codon:yes stop_codon:yes gene_type:complete